MKIFLVITYMFLNQFPAKSIVEIPDMETCEAVKAHLLRITPVNSDATFKCVNKSKS